MIALHRVKAAGLRWRVCACLLTPTYFGVQVSAAHAQGPVAAAPPSVAGAEPPGYREAIDAAISEHEAGHFAESRALFGRANALFPNARALRGLGMAEFELRNYASSIEYLEQALASAVKPLEGELRTETDQLLTRARGFVGRFHLALHPATASVLLNGALLEPSAAGLLVLTVGDHQLEVSATGYLPEQRTLSVTGGEDTTLQFTLLPQAALATAAPSEASRATPAETKRSVFASPWLWAAVGVVIVGAAVGIGVAASSGGGTHVADANGGTAGTVLVGP